MRRETMKTTFLGTALLALLVTAASFAAAAPGPAAQTTVAATPTWPYPLYGHATNGWGFTTASLARPGPTLVVTTGDKLALHLVSADGQTHTWGIDANNNTALDSGETQSTPFNATTGPIWFNLTVSLAAGTYVYRCGLHPGTMWGMLVVLAAPTFTLWGSSAAPNGWGLTSDTIRYPGPTLNVNQGATVTIDLFSADGTDHTFYVDFARSNSTTGNTVSADFNGTHPVRFTFVASAAGNFTYGCGIHGLATMKGYLDVTAAPPSSAAPNYTLYAAAIVVIAIIAIAVVLLIRRKPKAPPAQPPETPP